MSKNILNHEGNSGGRDFIVGDLHGYRSLLESMLCEVAFDRDRERLFSVGDLVDRGPDSLGTLGLLREPWFHAVAGNHEETMVEILIRAVETHGDLDPYTKAYVIKIGAGWIFDLKGKQLREAMELALIARELPLVRVVGEGDSRFQVVHAELDAWEKSVEYAVSDADIDADMEVAPETFITGAKEAGDWIMRAKWGRSLINRVRKEMAAPLPRPDCSPIYCGHTIVPVPVQIGNHVYLDTGGFLVGDEDHKKAGLTLVCPSEAIAWTDNGKRLHETTIKRLDLVA